jgi:hypothetical protein
VSNSDLYIPRPVLKLIIIAGLLLGILIAVGWVATGKGLLVAIASVILTPILVLISLYSYYVVIYIIWRIFWLVVGIGAALVIFLGIATLFFSENLLAFSAGLVVLLVSLVSWRTIDKWLPYETPEQRAVRYTNEERKAEGHPLWDKFEDEPEFPEPQRPRPRRPSPPPGRPDPDRINKEIAARKQRLNP